MTDSISNIPMTIPIEDWAFLVLQTLCKHYGLPTPDDGDRFRYGTKNTPKGPDGAFPDLYTPYPKRHNLTPEQASMGAAGMMEYFKDIEKAWAS